jgi:hypothetical protein
MIMGQAQAGATLAGGLAGFGYSGVSGRILF